MTSLSDINKLVRNQLASYTPLQTFNEHNHNGVYQPIGKYALESDIPVIPANLATREDLQAYQPKGDYALRSDVQRTGPMGATGPKGDTGSVGVMGPKGDTGPMGATGPKGDTGPMGATGPKGDTGSVGVMGPKGDTGPIGLMGPMGTIGTTGPKGEKGDMGPVGPRGSDGSGTGMFIDNFPAVAGQGAGLGWNRQSGSGVTTIFNQKGTGVGGFEFVAYDKDNKLIGTPITIDNKGNTVMRGNVSLVGKNVVHFGSDLTKESNAGKIGYGLLDEGINASLNIIGAGKSGENRTTRVWDNLTATNAIGIGEMPRNWRGANFQRKDGRWTQFDWKDDSKNYIRGDTVVDGLFTPKYTHSPYTDVVGNDIETRKDSTMQQCRDRCDGLPSCTGFNFQSAAHPNGKGVCAIKKSVVSKVNSADYHLYSKNY